METKTIEQIIEEANQREALLKEKQIEEMNSIKEGLKKIREEIKNKSKNQSKF